MGSMALAYHFMYQIQQTNYREFYVIKIPTFPSKPYGKSSMQRVLLVGNMLSTTTKPCQTIPTHSISVVTFLK